MDEREIPIYALDDNENLRLSVECRLQRGGFDVSQPTDGRKQKE